MAIELARPPMRGSAVVAGALACAAGVGVGVLASARQGLVPHLGFLASVPAAAILVVIAGLATVPLTLRYRWLGLVLFFVWLPFEDLVRKYAGNDVRVLLVKEFLFVVALVGLGRLSRSNGAWRRGAAEARFALFALIGWAVVMAFPSGSHNALVPLAGMRLDFLYAPLVGAGFLVASSPDRLQRTLRWMTILGAGVLAIGIAQAILGPTFLAPGRATPGLLHLVENRNVPGSQSTVYRPVGTFVDPARFAGWAFAFVVLGFVALRVQTTAASRRIVGVMLAIAVVGLFASGGRTTLVGGLFVVGAVAMRRRVGRRLGGATIAMVWAAVALVIAVSLFPKALGLQRSYYGKTLSPVSAGSEWSHRSSNYTRDAARGVRLGGLTGHGTGTHSLGLRYLVSPLATGKPFYAVESGYGSVAYEWGAFGLVLWVGWSALWFRRLRRSAREVRDTPYAPAARALLAFTFFFLFLAFAAGYNYFQDYGPNAFFWFVSGLIAGLPVAARSQLTGHVAAPPPAAMSHAKS